MFEVNKYNKIIHGMTYCEIYTADCEMGMVPANSLEPLFVRVAWRMRIIGLGS